MSSKPQAAADKTSLPAQREAGREFAESVGGIVVDTLEVPGASRDIILWSDAEAQIDAYRQLREHCQRRDFDVLHAVDMDRLGRTLSLASQVVDLVDAAGAEVYVADAPHVLGNKGTGQRYLYAIQSVRGYEMQRRRVERRRRGIRARVRRGLPHGAWPYGYAAVRDARGNVAHGELNDDAGAVRQMTRLFLAGMSYIRIAREMDDSAWSPPTAEQWNPGAIWDIMQNDFYAGVVAYNDLRVQSEYIPPLWDGDTYADVQAERRNRKASNQHRCGASPFWRVAFCARCGHTLVRADRIEDGPVGYAIRCGTHTRKAVTGVACHPNRTHEWKIADAICAFVADVVDLDRFEDVFTGDPEAARVEQSRVDLRQRVESIERQRKRLALAFAGGQMDIPVYRAADDELSGQAEAAEDALSELEQMVAGMPDPEQRKSTLVELRKRLADLWDQEPTAINAQLRRAGLRVWCEDGQVLSVGFGPVSVSSSSITSRYPYPP